MKKLAFIIAILGIAFLVFMLNAEAIEVKNADELNNLVVNKKVMLNGKVDSERDFEGFKIVEVNGVEVVCNCGKKIYLGKEVEVVGLVEEYEGRKQVRVLEISIVD